MAERDDKRFGWLRQMLEWQQELKDSREFMDSVRIDLFPGRGLCLYPARAM